MRSMNGPAVTPHQRYRFPAEIMSHCVWLSFPLCLSCHFQISASAETLIAIRGPDGRRLAGASRLEDGETVWRFVPVRPWRASRYAVVAHPNLEDPAGNRPCAPFEVIAASRIRCEEGTVQPFRARGEALGDTDFGGQR